MKYINKKSISIINYKGHRPKLDSSVFIADGVRIIGDVTLGKDVSVWFNTVIRGDVNKIQIGSRCNIQDNSCLHVEHAKFDLILEEGVTVGHSSVLHGCYIAHHCLIGMGATIMNGAVIGSESIIGAGALVPEGMQVPPRSVVLGCPAKVKRQVSDEEVQKLYESADNYVNYALSYFDASVVD